MIFIKNKGMTVKALTLHNHPLSCMNMTAEESIVLDKRLCECGCGRPTKPGNRFIIHHNSKFTNLGKKLTQETRNKMGISKLGEKHPLWKGDNVGVGALHAWLKRHLLQPRLCQICKTRPSRDLANITGIYNREFHNWKCLCRKCHSTLERLICLIGYARNVIQLRHGSEEILEDHIGIIVR